MLSGMALTLPPVKIKTIKSEAVTGIRFGKLS